MSQENVEIARRAMDAWDRDDLEAFLAELDPDLEWHTGIEGTAEGAETVFRGHDGVRQVWENYRGEVFSGMEIWATSCETSAATRSCGSVSSESSDGLAGWRWRASSP